MWHLLDSTSDDLAITRTYASKVSVKTVLVRVQTIDRVEGGVSETMCVVQDCRLMTVSCGEKCSLSPYTGAR